MVTPTARALFAGAIVAGAMGVSMPAFAHPHVFVESNVEIVGDKTGRFTAIRNVWRMDELFSSSVVVDFDSNANGALDPAELDAVGETIRQSIVDWRYYTFAELGSRDVKFTDPDKVHAIFEEGQLILFFEMPVAEEIDLRTQPIKVSNFDESFFVAFDFKDVDAFKLIGLPDGCRKALDVPDEDEAAQEWMDSIASLGPDEEVGEEGGQFADVMATRLEVSCGAQS
ncbi:hypothetical protein FP2506_17064 [Fulvimarina pelagi HTCC2506]|uniref:DUF1007 family protein n=1 Tax=Fulvimarina pelagi HTCC2506 TaxID=314231 RepID=Q0G2L7_9HYPH|nr:DUF1007 family protein [Fulvimarina pelagi]EAU42164.1 hypothetical protein FP2506_17064 [Fulvimarina pelagi HTCC2506]